MGRIKDTILENKITFIIALVSSILGGFLSIRNWYNKGQLTEAKLRTLTNEQRVIVFQLREGSISDRQINGYIRLWNHILLQIRKIQRLIYKGEYTKASNSIINVKGDLEKMARTGTFDTSQLEAEVLKLRFLLGERIKSGKIGN